MNNPRIPGLKGIMQSKKKPVDVIALHDLISHIPDEDVLTRTVRYEEKPVRKPGKKLTGEPEEIARELVRALGRETTVLRSLQRCMNSGEFGTQERRPDR